MDAIYYQDLAAEGRSILTRSASEVRMSIRSAARTSAALRIDMRTSLARRV